MGIVESGTQVTFLEGHQLARKGKSAFSLGAVYAVSAIGGLVGAAVTNPASVGGAGVTLALQLLNGETPESQEVLMEPVLWANDTEEGIAELEAANDPDIDPTWPLGITIEGWTDYTKEEILACEGP